MLWPTLAWSTGLAGGIGSAFAVKSLPWRYAPPIGVWLGGLWLDGTSYGLLRRVGEGAIWGGAGSFVGLVGYDLWKQYQQWDQQYQQWFGKIAPPSEPVPVTTQPDSAAAPQGGPTQDDQQKDTPIEPDTPNAPAPPTMGTSSIFFPPPRVSQGHYPTRDSWWRHP